MQKVIRIIVEKFPDAGEYNHFTQSLYSNDCCRFSLGVEQAPFLAMITSFSLAVRQFSRFRACDRTEFPVITCFPGAMLKA